MKKIVAYLLLASFAILFTPRDWWHDCHHDHAVELSGDSSHYDSDNCDFCDWDLSSFTVHQDYIFTPQKNQKIVHAQAIFANHKAEFEQFFQLRAPPSFL
ncbi:MAG: hypothetical protein RL264_1381 [Bacteroidota bacterium]|jgi:hypothetical protein